jgi:L-malate glycosyltransferase
MRSLHIDTARTWRGGQNQVLLTVTALAEAGHDAILLAHEDGELKRRAGEGMRFLGFAPRSEFDVQAAWRLVRVIGDLKPAVIHAHDPMAVSLVAMALQMGGAKAQRPLVVASRRVDFHLKRHAFSKWKYRHVDVFVAASRVIAAILESDGIERDRIAVVHDGVDVERIDRHEPVDVHKTFWLPHGAPVVANVAALAPHKGQKHLVAAAAELVRRIPDARMLILGDGELKDALQHQISSLGLDRHVTLTGFRADVIGILKSVDLVVMSSITEGLGSVILEAMACRRAVVGTRAGGIPEAIEDQLTGLLVPVKDEGALADALSTLLPDADRRRTMGAAGRARVEAEFSLDALVRATLAVYSRSAGQRSAEDR